MNRAYKFKLYPTPEQEQQLTELVGISRWIWNYMLTKKQRKIRRRKEICIQI